MRGIDGIRGGYRISSINWNPSCLRRQPTTMAGRGLAARSPSGSPHSASPCGEPQPRTSSIDSIPSSAASESSILFESREAGGDRSL